MFPSQTSLIPVTVALTGFIEANGLSSLFSWYPHWYLGVPYRFLTGPVIPVIEFLIHKLFPNVSLFNISIYLIIVSFLAGAVGWGILLRKITNYQLPITIFFFLVLLLLILPWRYFSALTLGEASFTIARNLLPYSLIAFWSYLKGKSKLRGEWAVIAGAFILLINTSILPILTVGLIGVVLAKSFKEGKFRRVYKNIKSTLLLLTCSLLLVTFFWYTPSYWLTLLSNPSIGGASGFKVILRIFDLLRAGVPLFLAAIAVYFSGKVKNRLTVFTLIWILTFGFLTLFRFIGDPDFWMDWTAWFYELEVGAALLLSNFILSILDGLKTRNDKFQMTNGQLISKLVTNSIFLIALFLLPFFFVWRINLVLGKPTLLSTRLPEGIASLEKLAELAGKDGFGQLTTSRVFLSGSTVFWAGSTGASTELSRMSSPLTQVRGGKDGTAIHPFWHHAAYQLREGDDPQLARAWLNALGVSWVLVHTDTSSEFYHDFRSVYKWSEIGKLVWKEQGDEIYKIPDSYIAWTIDQNILKGVLPPKDGKDMVALEKYLSARIKPLNIKMEGNSFLVENPDSADLIDIIVTYNSGWKAYSEKDQLLRIERDPFSHLLVYTNKSQRIFLSY